MQTSTEGEEDPTHFYLFEVLCSARLGSAVAQTFERADDWRREASGQMILCKANWVHPCLLAPMHSTPDPAPRGLLAIVSIGIHGRVP